MGREGYGWTVFISGLLFSPLAYMMGGLIGLIEIWILICFLLFMHFKKYSSAPDVIERDIDKPGMYTHGKSIVESFPKRKLTDEEKMYNQKRCIVYEIAYQSALKNNRKQVTKRDYRTAAIQTGLRISNHGVYFVDYLNAVTKEEVYIIKFSEDLINSEPDCGNISNRHRFLYID